MSRTPAAVITEFAAALHDGRLDDALAGYEPDAAFIAQPGTEPVYGLDQIRAAPAGRHLGPAHRRPWGA